ncbi:MAG: AAA family ATPase [bacterium]
MKLLYLWVEEYRILKDIELNFDSNIRFSYDKKNDELRRIKPKNEIPEKFFSLNNAAKNVVESVSAIIGNNGSGKTTLFNLISRTLWNDVNVNFILIFKKGEDSWLHIKRSGEYYKIKEFDQGEVFNLKDKNDTFFDLKNENRQNEKPFALIYHSQYFNPQGSFWVDNSTIDISTTYLIENDHKRYYNTGTVLEGEAPLQNKIKAHSAMELIRNADFLNRVNSWEEKNNKKLDFGFNFPSGVVVEINEDEEKIFLSEVSKKADDQKKRIIDDLIKLFDKEQTTKDKNKIFIYNISKALLLNYLRGNGSLSTSNSKPIIDYYKELENYLKKAKNWWSVFNNYFKKMAEQQLKLGDQSINHSDSRAAYALKMINFLKNLTDAKYYETYQFDRIVFDLKEQEDLKKFEEFTKIYFKTNTITHYMLFKWRPGISAGEQSHLNIFSRLIKTFSTDLNSKYNDKNFLVFFDEIETTLHPEWQRMLVKNIIKFFEEFFEKKEKDLQKHVHLIFATHSPILLSDIPVGNCCFLKREQGTFDTRVVENENETAFGSNIYNLYKSSYFMENGLTGLFAEEKINKVFSILNKDSNHINDAEKDYCQKTIANIGETIVKEAIKRKMSDKFKENIDEKIKCLENMIKSTDEKTKYLENEIKKLKEMKNDTDKNS